MNGMFRRPLKFFRIIFNLLFKEVLGFSSASLVTLSFLQASHLKWMPFFSVILITQWNNPKNRARNWTEDFSSLGQD